MSIHDLIFRLLSWIVPDKYEPPDPVGADARTDIAVSVLQPVADKYGLTYRGPREWYSQEGPIRLTVRLTTEGKGNSHGELRWGAGFDCVPDTDKGWTRTFKSAVTHVQENWSTIHPDAFPRKTVSFMSGEEEMRQQLIDVLSESESEIEKFYARMATAESAVAYLKEQIPKLPHYWRYDFYLPFLLKECGRQDEARAAMEDYLSKNPNIEPSIAIAGAKSSVDAHL